MVPWSPPGVLPPRTGVFLGLAWICLPSALWNHSEPQPKPPPSHGGPLETWDVLMAQVRLPFLLSPLGGAWKFWGLLPIH